MSVASVRAALGAYFTAGCDPVTGSVPGVLRVYKAMPWYVDGSTWELNTNLGSGAVIFLHLSHRGETRLADPSEGVTPTVVGVKQVDYDAMLVVLYQFLIPSASQSPAVSEDSWVDPLDLTIQGLKDLIHKDPTAGTGPVEDGGDGTRRIFEMGQDDGDLSDDEPIPRRTPGKIWTWPVLKFTVREVITA